LVGSGVEFAEPCVIQEDQKYMFSGFWVCQGMEGEKPLKLAGVGAHELG